MAGQTEQLRPAICHVRCNEWLDISIELIISPLAGGSH